METKEKKRKNLVEFLFENSCCINCIVNYYCGSFISKEDCLKCIDDSLTELLQHDVSISACCNDLSNRYWDKKGSKCLKCGNIFTI